MIDSIDIVKLKEKINNSTILITGGTGSFGNEFIKFVGQNCNPKKIIVLSRDEFKQFKMMKIFTDDKYPFLRFLIGDIKDLNRLQYAFKGVDYIFHAAALKHVPIIEYNPIEAVKTNIYGTENVIRAAIDNNIKEVIALSTDKCVEPCNLYGATKLCLEKLIIGGNILSGNRTKFSVLRYGNVLGSRGSVIPFFNKQKETGILTVTDKKMTRFTLTLSQAINFVLNSFLKMIGGEIFVPKLPSYNIIQLANIIGPNCEKKEIGIRPGEKLHESMVGQHESYLTIECENSYVILPSITNEVMKKKFTNVYGNHFCKQGFSYSSGNNYLINDEKFKKMINNFIKNYN
tara:strand:- start:271 stop:1305 length:1035 start_codon:yes stop_codon:yes gene_type:complete